MIVLGWGSSDKKKRKDFFFFFVVLLKQIPDLWFLEKKKKEEKLGYSFQEMIHGTNRVYRFVHKTEFIFWGKKIWL